MAENVEQVVNDEVVETPENQEPQFNEVEKRAMEMGWRPKTEYSGDEETFVDAKEFIGRKPLYDRIEQANKRTKDLEKAILSLQEHHKRVEEATRKELIKELKAQKKVALEEGDADKVIDIDDQIVQHRAEELLEKNKPEPQATNTPPVEFVDWQDRNTWYVKDAELREEADALGFAIKAKNPNASTEEILNKVTERIKRLFPEKFQNPRRGQPSAVEGASTKPVQKKSGDDFEMSPEEEAIMKRFARTIPNFDKAAYIADLKKVRG